MDKITALSILQQARVELIKKGMLFPEIIEDHVDVKNDMPIYKADWNVRDDQLYRPSLNEFEKIVFEIMGKRWVEPEGGFWIHYDENFKKETPDIWKKKSREENATVQITDPTLQGESPKQKDEFETYVDDIRPSPEPLPPQEPPRFNLKTPEKEASFKASYEVIIDGEELPETSLLDLPDDTYIEIPE